MTLDEYNAYCKSFAHAEHVVQWGGAHVWKLGGKVFAIAGWQEKGRDAFVTFKCSRLSYELLQQQAGCRPAPYLASRGLLWIQRTSSQALGGDDLKSYLRESYALVAAGLTKKRRAELGLDV